MLRYNIIIIVFIILRLFKQLDNISNLIIEYIIYKIYIDNIYSTKRNPTTSAIEYILYILYLLAKIIVCSRTIIV